MGLRRKASAAGIVVLASALAGCGMIGEMLSGDDGGEADIDSLRVGDCLLVDDEIVGAVASSPRVPCSEPHEDEVFALVTAELEVYPGEMEMFGHADEVCAPHFEDYVGIPVEESELFIWAYTPTPDGWEMGDREIICVAAIDGQMVTESFKDSRR